MRGTCTFMQIVHILRYHRHLEIFFQLSEDLVTGIGLYFQCTLSSLIVKVEYQRRVFLQAFRGCNLGNVITFPESIRVAKRGNTTFCADTSPTKHNQVLHIELKMNLNLVKA